MGLLSIFGGISSMLGNAGSGAAALTELGLFGGNEEEREEAANKAEMAGGVGEMAGGASEVVEGAKEGDIAGIAGGGLGFLSGLFGGGAALGKKTGMMNESQANTAKGFGGLFGMGSGIAGLFSAFHNKEEKNGAAVAGKGISGAGSFLKGLGATIGGFGGSDKKAKTAGNIISALGAGTGLIGGLVSMFGKKKKQPPAVNPIEGDAVEDDDIGSANATVATNATGEGTASDVLEEDQSEDSSQSSGDATEGSSSDDGNVSVESVPESEDQNE